MLFYWENVHKNNYMFCGNMYQGSLYIKICLYKIEKNKFESQNKAQIQIIFSFQRQKYDYYTIHIFFYMFKSE